MMIDPPTGAIENGREHLRRLIEHYEFECAGGPLRNCADFQEAVRCFEALAAWVAETPSTYRTAEMPTVDGCTLTAQEVSDLHSLKVGRPLWRIVAKATGWDEDQFLAQVPYMTKLECLCDAEARFPQAQ